MRWDEIKSRLLSLMNEEDVTHERPLCSGSGASKMPPESANALWQPWLSVT